MKYSVLFELPYIDPTRMIIKDPMHNLLLGTAKHMLNVWKETGKIKANDMELMQEKVDGLVGPSDVGRISSFGLSCFTADQWKNWTLLYSLACVKPILPIRDFKCWLYFVKACHILWSRKINLSEAEEAHDWLTKIL